MEFLVEQRVHAIEERNALVAQSKAWERSWTRRLLLAGCTYLVVVIYSFCIGATHPFIQSLVPVFGYLISTLTIPWAKHRWVKAHFPPKE